MYLGKWQDELCVVGEGVFACTSPAAPDRKEKSRIAKATCNPFIIKKVGFYHTKPDISTLRTKKDSFITLLLLKYDRSAINIMNTKKERR